MANDRPTESTPATDGTTPPASEEAVFDTLLDVLSYSRRRQILSRLDSGRTPMSLANLADEIVVHERDAPLAEIPARDVKQVYMSLYHSHVPRLEDADLVEYDQERDAVSLRERSPVVDRYEALVARC
ncbi:DUF7344 domain-containing protein [Haladaptatus halobius]|uniref:DUF7344 domain-containing protein n=1 Tax=Haladaptatus halobius TaxID=2884875 RepID=UPI001D0A0332|nr:hypothetical protein [Haladaptatus halobius]